MELILENKDKYRFQDFTLSAYKGLIESLLHNGYRFISYEETNVDTPWVLWRHDLDFSPQRALKLAKIEAELGVRSTFFLLPHSRFYNLFEKEISDIIFQIKDLGHELGLHFDFAHYNIKDLRHLEDACKHEKSFLEWSFKVDIKAFSFHNPNEWALKVGVGQVSDMVNAYSDYFMKNVAYASDSNGYWRNESIQQRIEEKHPRLQILTHPVWWTEKLSSPKERVWSAIDGRADGNKKKQLEHWKKWKRELPDW